jgi:transcriptional regulator with XRE-family HTH domain
MVQTTVSGLPTIGDVILAWRKFRGLRSTELVKKARIKKGYLSAVEHNKRANPQEEYLVKLADALEVPLQDIYGRRMPPEKREDGKAEEEEAKDAGGKEKQDQNAVGLGRGLKAGTQAISTPMPTAANPALALPDSLLYITFEQMETLIRSRDLSKEQMRRMTAGLLDSTNLLLEVIKPQHEGPEED